MTLDPVEMLNILGNENRRRILQLLSFRPFYFNEMVKRLEVGPKAVINHLNMLERAGLIECYRDDDGRRKYFRISKNVVLEVAVSPHTYGIRTYKIECAAQKSINVSSDIDQLRSRFRVLEKKRIHLMRLLEEIESEKMDLKRQAINLIEEHTEDQLETEILIALVSGRSSTESLANKLRIPTVVVEDILRRLEAQGKAHNNGSGWTM
ncbi:MAG: ArsR/SmtB family transcription factor [Methanotrichaceae archaeon]